MTQQLFDNTTIFSSVDKGRPLAGSAQGELAYFKSGAVLVEDGLIADVGDEVQVRAVAKTTEAGEPQEIDCCGRCMVPGFVDPHMCFAALREEVFALRLAGTPYLEILRQGGGILSSVHHQHGGSGRQSGCRQAGVFSPAGRRDAGYSCLSCRCVLC